MKSDNVKDRKRRPVARKPVPNVNNLSDLIAMAENGKKYPNIDNEMLERIQPQLAEINGMIGMHALKESIFHHVVYYLLDLHVNDYLHTVIMGPPGCGKCLAKDTMIRMYDGSVRAVQDIKVGDCIMGDDSTRRRVESTSQGTEHLFKISSIISDDMYVANESHILSLEEHETNRIVDIPLSTYLMTPHDYLGYRASAHFERIEYLNTDAYVLGYSLMTFILVGDVIVINITNPKIRDRCGCYVVNIGGSSFQLLEMEEHMQCFRDLIFPNNLLFLSHDVLHDMLCGVCDASSNDELHFTDAGLFNGVRLICNILGIDYSSEKRSMLFKDKNAPPMHHYILNVNSRRMNSIVTYPINVVPMGIGEYFGFELSGNGRFMLENFTITHNTTVAKIIGEMYINMGILSPDGTFKTAKREDFIAEYLGQTAIKTKRLLDSSLGGVLFIDEVYALGPGQRDHDSFSKEAIDTLNVFLSEHSDRFCCVIAGYEQDIKNCFFNVNQGLERRFQWVHRIEEYSVDELAQMFIKQVADIQWKLDSGLNIKVMTNIIQRNKRMFKSFGGDIENYITKCKMAHAKRIISQTNPLKHVLTLADIELGMELMKPNSIAQAKDDLYVCSMYI